MILGTERYRCSECSEVSLCLKCHALPESKSVHHDSAPMPHQSTLESKSDDEYYSSIKGDSFYDCYIKIFKFYSTRRCIGMITKFENSFEIDKVHWITYQQLFDISQKLGSAMKQQNIELGSKVIVSLHNIPDWYYFEFALLFYGYTMIPVSSIMSEIQIKLVREICKPSTIVVSKVTFPKFVDSIEYDYVKAIIHVGDDYDQNLRNLLSPSIKFFVFSELINSIVEISPHSPIIEGTLSIVFSSGSTGPSKGVELTTSIVHGEKLTPFPKLPIQMGFLSISNAQRYYDLKIFASGGRIGIVSSGEMEDFFREIVIFRPNFFWCNPGFLEIKKEKSFCSDQEIESKALSSTKNKLGDRIQFVVTSGSIVSNDTFDFMKKCWGEENTFDLYACVETAEVSLNGKLFPHISFKIIPIQGYSNESLNPIGELWIQSPRTIKEYYRNREETLKAFKDGWYNTGDIVEEYEPRTIRIVSRSKNFFKTSIGKYVFPEILENYFLKSSLIKNIFFYGDSFHLHLVAIVIPSTDSLKKYMGKMLDNIDDNAELKNEIFNEIKQISKVSKIGVCKSDKVEIISNETGFTKTPCIVAFSDERFVGEFAKQQIVNLNPLNIIYDCKRLIGRSFTDPLVQYDMRSYPFRVVSRENNKPFIEVNYRDDIKSFKPEEITAILIKELKDHTESILQQPVKNAVITVPVYFDDEHCQATKDAAAIANIRTVSFIEEPIAAAIAYGLHKRSGKNHVFVFDLGGQTCNATVLRVEDGEFEILSTTYDQLLGGNNFNSCLQQYLESEFQRQNQITVNHNHRSLHLLKNACEKAKKSLSTLAVAHVEIDSFLEGIDLTCTVSRLRFDELTVELVDQCMDLVDKAILETNIDKDTIDEIILSGGSTNIVNIQTKIQNYFSGKTLNNSIDPDQVLAHGAAIKAADLYNNNKQPE
ncbi:hypothetical protein PPL_06507 [Heterostelium album PN500]|uniref:AMP-dependent synthetase/ligase domain-containing protein n=1 Tax=Heterostelium pallidum (strain ATCC 26659 / Pp 5 / PN500) TaxID=670386 RepID=D3BDC4_HETP5|nr:hypothetical protein PPL_06507 [Heterostelium album PN500]EFA80568.1 hypothetical protein PPL_06507 [Heterostelium album PN500]|eukprot:XP_020432688.1 hypothetical protein PPL_06507 [Heterostelium album PN500]